jgi:hypothetical protein
VADTVDRLLADPHISEDDLCGESHWSTAPILMAIELASRLANG